MAKLVASTEGKIDWDSIVQKCRDSTDGDFNSVGYPGKHFDIEVQNKFADIVNADPRRVFVSELWPGRCVPKHWDVEDQEKEWLAEGELKRWVVFIDKPKFGHVLLFDNQDAFYNIPQHQVWEWDHYRNWHAGTNCGSEPYYLFHFLGKPR